jgi:hypothetical protein
MNLEYSFETGKKINRAVSNAFHSSASSFAKEALVVDSHYPRAVKMHDETVYTIIHKVNGHFNNVHLTSRTLYHHPLLSDSSRVIKKEGQLSVLVNSAIIKFDNFYLPFRKMQELNPDVDLDSYGRNIIARGYGKIILKEALKNNPLSGNVKQADKKAFALWFGDSISEVNTPLELIDKLPNSSQIKQKYLELKGNKFSHVFHNLAQVGQF